MLWLYPFSTPASSRPPSSTWAGHDSPVSYLVSSSAWRWDSPGSPGKVGGYTVHTVLFHPIPMSDPPPTVTFPMSLDVVEHALKNPGLEVATPWSQTLMQLQDDKRGFACCVYRYIFNADNRAWLVEGLQIIRK